MASEQVLNLFLDFEPLREFARQVALGARQYCLENPRFAVRMRTAPDEISAEAETVDGVIGLLPETYNGNIDRFRGRPVVNVSARSEVIHCPTITLDGISIGEMAADHLMTQGYRTFACHMDSNTFYSRQRCQGFADSLQLSHHDCAIFDTAKLGDEDTKSRRKKTIGWLKQLAKPAGLFTHNDLQATQLINLCQDAQINVPDEIGIIGVDNDAFLAHMVSPPLSSVDPGTFLVGYQAAATLARMLSGEQVPNTRVYVPARQVISRGSTDAEHLVDDRLKAALEYIREHGTKLITVDKVLSEVPASRRSLERLFRANLGRSPAEEIGRIRINHAKWLLAATGRPLGHVADECGYSTYQNFATAFRRETGLSASDYRNRFRGREAVTTS
jgi:LacI family transcriptional regulator